MTPSFDDLVAEGLFDPEAPDADERRVLLERALAAGSTVDMIRQAIDEHWLHVVPTRLAMLGRSATMTVAEAGARVGLSPETARRVWDAVRLTDSGGLECTEDDVAIFEFYVRIIPVFGEEETLQVARVHGAAIAMMADAEVAQVRSLLEAPQRVEGADNVAVGELWLDVTSEFFTLLERALVRLHRHQALTTGRRYTLWGAPTEEATADVVVGFADLVGFTALEHTLTPRQVDGLLRTFEARAVGTATSATTRVVKLIGDEVMYVAGTTDEALAIARALVDDPDLPDLRVGIAAGRVVTRAGDVFGSPVNLAARLVATAQPGEILLDAVAAGRANDADALEPRGARDLPGYPEPVVAYAFNPGAG